MCALERHRSWLNIAACYISQIGAVEAQTIYKIRRASNTEVWRYSCTCKYEFHKIMSSMLIRGQLGPSVIVNKAKLLFHVLFSWWTFMQVHHQLENVSSQSKLTQFGWVVSSFSQWFMCCQVSTERAESIIYWRNSYSKHFLN